VSNRLKLFNTKKLNSLEGGMKVTDRAIELFKQFTGKELSLVSEGVSCENQHKFDVFGLEIDEDNDAYVLEQDWVIAQVQADLENSPDDKETFRQRIMPIIKEAIDRGLFENWYDVTDVIASNIRPSNPEVANWLFNESQP
jgi:hypothetical protein